MVIAIYSLTRLAHRNSPSFIIFKGRMVFSSGYGRSLRLKAAFAG